MKGTAAQGSSMGMATFPGSASLLATALVVAGSMACSADVPAPAEKSVASSSTGRPPLNEGFAGRVVDESGHPLQGALVVPRSLDIAGPPIPELAVVSDRSGRFQWRLPAGNYEISVVVDRYQAVKRQVRVEKGKVTDIEVVLRRIR